jgi:hypothetical protein
MTKETFTETNASLATIAGVLARLEKRLDVYFPPSEEQKDCVGEKLDSLAATEARDEILEDAEEDVVNILIHANEPKEQSDPSVQPLTPDQQEVMEALQIHTPVTIRDLKCRSRKVRQMSALALGAVLNQLTLLGKIERHFAETVYTLPGQEPQERRTCPFVPAYDVIAVLNKQLELLGRIAEAMAVSKKL